jgi:hypothetical protein
LGGVTDRPTSAKRRNNPKGTFHAAEGNIPEAQPTQLKTEKRYFSKPITNNLKGGQKEGLDGICLNVRADITADSQTWWY